MRKASIIITTIAICLTGCTYKSEEKPKLSDSYNIGDEITLADIKFNVCKIDDFNSQLYLWAQDSITTTKYSDGNHQGSYVHSYEGSIVEDYVDKFVEGLEQNGVGVISSGLIDEKDLYKLGFEHSDGLSGRPYHYTGEYDFISPDESFWVGGYCKYETMSWVYYHGYLDPDSCDEEYDLRPVIVISPAKNEDKPA